MDVFLIRQPIFDRRQNVFAYEILCRSQQADCVECSAGQPAAPSTIANALLLIGLQRISSGKKAFIGCSPTVITADLEAHLPAPMVVIEVLKAAEPDGLFVDSCTRLKAAGYQLSLGEAALRQDSMARMVDLVDFVKIDFSKFATADGRSGDVRAFAPGARLLAHGVETREAFRLALDAGHDYFQGNFFSQAEIISSRDIPSYKLNHLRILHELNRVELDFAALETVIRRDVSLSYKLLNCVNSVFFGVRSTVSSIHHALTLLGEREIRKWTALVILKDLGQDKPAELLVSSLVRANFSESLAALAGLRAKAPELFIMGLFSLLDVIVGRPMQEIMEDMPLSSEIKTALMGSRNRFRDILELVLSYEKGDLKRFLALASRLRVDEGLITDAYLRAIDLTEEAMQLYGPRTADGRQQG
jgi:c-di-GMP-related signal transduction protein